MIDPYRRTRLRRTRRGILVSTAVVAAVGVLYGAAVSGMHPHAILMGAVIGAVVGGLGSAGETLFFQPHARRLSFAALLVLRSAFYLLLIAVTVPLVVAAHEMLMGARSFAEAVRSPGFVSFFLGGEILRTLLLIGASVLAINFIRQVNRLLGTNAVRYFLTGTYHRPVEERRIFMFLDLTSSTAIAEKLGHVTYHRFLDDFFHDIGPAIEESGGEIYQYVGDEVVVTWREEDGLRDAACVACWFRARAAVDLAHQRYTERYGAMPLFKAGVHLGPVVAGEIGDVRKGIVFHGDTVNTAARIRSFCSTAGRALLLSGELARALRPPMPFTLEPLGPAPLAGKENPVELFGVREAE